MITTVSDSSGNSHILLISQRILELRVPQLLNTILGVNYLPLFVLHQMWTLWIMTLIRSTASAHISITWKVWYFTFSNNWPWSSIFWRSKTFGFVYREDINTFTVNVKHWVFFFPVMFTNISLPLALWLTPGFVLLNVLVSDV